MYGLYSRAACNQERLMMACVRYIYFLFLDLVALKPKFFLIALMSLEIPYARHHKPLLITSHSWIQAIHKDRSFWKNLLENKEMVFENGVKNIQAAAYNGAHTVY
jgi:hypothetical protein